jgi:hypothetical protein
MGELKGVKGNDSYGNTNNNNLKKNEYTPPHSHKILYIHSNTYNIISQFKFTRRHLRYRPPSTVSLVF